MRFVLYLILFGILPAWAEQSPAGVRLAPARDMLPEAQLEAGETASGTRRSGRLQLRSAQVMDGAAAAEPDVKQSRQVVSGRIKVRPTRTRSIPPAKPFPRSREDDFLAANAAYRAKDPARLARYAGRLQQTVLEVYVTYYQLRLDLEHAEPDRVKRFLERPDDTPVIDRLRGEWLRLLGKNQQWDLFDAEYPHLQDGDTELTCYALQSRLRSQPNVALREVRNLWFSGDDQPESCAPLFESALSIGIISEPDVWLRLRQALEQGNVSLARQLAERLRGPLAVPSTALKQAAIDPDRYLEQLPPGRATMGQRTVILFALLRLAKQSPDLAVQRWDKLAPIFSAGEQQYFYGWLAYEAARKLDSRALQWFRAAADATLNEEQAAWRVRAALRAQDWRAVLDGIDAMTPQQQRAAPWQYWKARALQALGDTATAQELYTGLSRQFDFYGQLAAEELQAWPVQHAVAHDQDVPAFKPRRRDLADMLALAGIQRTLALYRMDMLSEARREWNWTLRNFSDRELLTAADIARRNEMYDRAIVAADKTVNLHDFSLRFLAPYRAALQTHIRENDLEEAWVYGLMRQESRFVTAAKSQVGAAGLMQIMPATARWVARKLGLKNYRQSLIHELDTNLRLGTYYMKTVLGWFDNSPVLASAAYNAGPGRARRWRGEQPLEGAIYAETIPFNETRNYVKNVMSNTVYYARQFGEPPRSLKQRLGVVAPKTTENQQPIPDEQ